jgi:hypothetical protein
VRRAEKSLDRWFGGLSNSMKQEIYSTDAFPRQKAPTEGWWRESEPHVWLTLLFCATNNQASLYQRSLV